MSIDKLTDKLTEIAATLQGPGLEAARQAARIEPYSSLMGGALCAAIAAAIALGIRWMWKSDAVDEELRIVLSGFGGIALAFLIPIALWTFVDPWVWTTIASPELWLAKKTLKL